MKTLLIATEPYATSMLLAERQLLMSFAYVAPADRQAIVPLVPGGFGYPAELRGWVITFPHSMLLSWLSEIDWHVNRSLLCEELK